MFIAELRGCKSEPEEWVEWARCCDEHYPTEDEAMEFVRQAMEPWK